MCLKVTSCDRRKELWFYSPAPFDHWLKAAWGREGNHFLAFLVCHTHGPTKTPKTRKPSKEMLALAGVNSQTSPWLQGLLGSGPACILSPAPSPYPQSCCIKGSYSLHQRLAISKMDHTGYNSQLFMLFLLPKMPFQIVN